jgi:2'-5' RNA ligase
MTSREDESFEQRWEQYRQLTHLKNHWYWRPGWGSKRTFYTWHLTFENQAELHALTAEVQRYLDTPALDPVPAEGLHLTMQGIGFTDEVTDADLAAIINAVQERCAELEEFELMLGPIDPDAEGIGLLVRPWQAVDKVRNAIRNGIASVWDDVPETSGGFRPHVTMAYSGADAPTAGLMPKLASLRDLRTVTVRIAAAQLISLRRRGRAYEWDTIAEAQLSKGFANV